MPGFSLTPAVREDLANLWRYIAGDSVAAADSVEAEIYRACEFLSHLPEAGRLKPDLTDKPLRFWTIPRYRRYVIVYDPNRRPLEIIRILHGAMDLPRRL